MSKDRDEFNKYMDDARQALDLVRTKLVIEGMFDGATIIEGYLKSLVGFKHIINQSFNIKENNVR